MTAERKGKAMSKTYEVEVEILDSVHGGDYSHIIYLEIYADSPDEAMDLYRKECEERGCTRGCEVIEAYH
jgi:hypothetical protein